MPDDISEYAIYNLIILLNIIFFFKKYRIGGFLKLNSENNIKSFAIFGGIFSKEGVEK